MLKHKKNVTVPDGGDTSVVRPSDWNDDHQVTGGFDLPLESVAVPPTDTVRLFGRKVGGRMMPAFKGPSGLDSSLQAHLGRNKVGIWSAAGGSTTVTQFGLVVTAQGTATTANVATTNAHTAMRRVDYLVTTAAATAIASIVTGGNAVNQFFRGVGDGLGGFHLIMRFGGATGMATATHRFFAGMAGGTSAPTDVDPATRTDAFGVGYDSADSTWHLIHRAGSAAATKISLGASFPRQSVDRSKMYELVLFCPPGGTSIVYEFTDLLTGDIATGSMGTNIPAATSLVKAMITASVGGTSSVIGLALSNIYVETDY